MKPKTIFLLIIQFLLIEAKSQIAPSQLYLYRTEEDFFSDKKINRGEVLNAGTMKSYFKYITPEGKKNEIAFEDSSDFYKGFQWGQSKFIKVYPKGMYCLFGGGTKDIFCCPGGNSATYDKDGYATSIRYQDWFEITFVDKKRDIKTQNIEVFLASYPDLLDKYKNEKKESDKKAWKREKLQIGIKYLKLYIAEASK